MTRVDEILQEMEKGTPLKKIRAKYPSQSQLYEAFRIYLPKAENEIQQKQKNLSSLESQQKASKQHVQSMNSEISRISNQMAKEKEAHHTWIGEAEKRKSRLQKENAILEGNIEKKGRQLDGINQKLAELAKIDITPELVTHVYEMELESKEDLLERVKTSSDYTTVKEEIEESIRGKTLLRKEIDSLEKEKNSTIEEITSQKNILDELRLKNRNFKKAVSVMHHFFKSGYNTEDLKRLKDGSDLLQVKGNPSLSIDRLVRGLEKARSLTSLNREIERSKKMLQTLQENIAEADGQLNAIHGTVIKVIDKTREHAVKQIIKTAQSGRSEIIDLGEDVKKKLNRVEDEARRSLIEADSQLSTTVLQLKNDFEEWGNVRERAGELKKQMRYGVRLLGILETPETLKEIPLSVIAGLMDRISLWASMNLSNTTMKPSVNIHNKQWQLQTYQDYSLPTIFEWCKEELRKRLREQTVNGGEE